MELSELEAYPVTKPFPVKDGKTIAVTWDANKFTGELGRRMARVYRERARQIEAQSTPQNGNGHKRKSKAAQSLAQIADDVVSSMELRATIEDLDREMYADALASDRYGILLAWEVTDKGRAVEPTFDVLMRQPSLRLKQLLTFCREESLPEKKDPAATNGSPTTTSITPDTSLSPITHSPETSTTQTTSP